MYDKTACFSSFLKKLLTIISKKSPHIAKTKEIKVATN